MRFYDRVILPRILNCLCGSKTINAQRARVVPLATGRVLEVGFGTGLNLPFYDPNKIDRVIGLDPAEEMLALAHKRADAVPFPVEQLALEGESIPLEDNSVDTVVVTYSLCTIPDNAAALANMRRVLKPGGQLLFCEHGRAPDAGIQRLQRGINPVWKRMLGGCHLDREIPSILRGNGFRIEALDVDYLRGLPRFAGFNYWGVATPA